MQKAKVQTPIALKSAKFVNFPTKAIIIFFSNYTNVLISNLILSSSIHKELLTKYLTISIA